MGRRGARHFTHHHRVSNRAPWSARPARRIRLGRLVTRLVPSGAPMVLGADDTVAHRRGRPSTATGGSRAAVRSTRAPVIHGCGVTWGVRRLWIPRPWARRVWAWPCRTARCQPAEHATPRRHKPSVDGVRPRRRHARRWLPGRPLVWGVEGGWAAVSLAWAGGHSQGTMGSPRRWEAALSYQPGPQLPGQRGPQPTTGTRQRRVPAGAERPETPWETVIVDGSRGPRTTLGMFSPPGLWHMPGVPPGERRLVIGCEPAGPLRMAACFCTDLPATPVHILTWVVLRWSVEGTGEAGRARLGLATRRHGSDQAIARTTPVLCALVTLLARQLSPEGQMPVPVIAWEHKAEPTCADGLALVRRPFGRARYMVNAAAEAESRPCPHAVLDLLIHRLPLAASLAKVEINRALK
jgi:hypothetical protein